MSLSMIITDALVDYQIIKLKKLNISVKYQSDAQ